MFSKEELKKYAQTLWWGLSTARTEPYAPGDNVLLRFDPEALPLAEAMFDLLMEKGLNPVARQNLSSTMEVSFYGKGNDSQLENVASGDRQLIESLHGLISLIAPSSLTHLQNIDPKRISKVLVARKFMREIMEKREQTGEFGWTLCIYPTMALAEASGLTMDRFKAQVVKACYLDHEDPAGRWQALFDQAQGVKGWLNSLDVKTLRVQSENTDLTVTPGEHRRWLGVSGHNIPSFEIFLSPDWRGTQGVYYADQPSFRSGNYVEGVRLTFENGKVVKSEAKQGGDFVAKQLELDDGAGKLGEFSLTDRRSSQIDAFMANTLFDENFGGEYGNCHVAVGASYADTYSGDQTTFDETQKQELGFNDSALHWDLVSTEPKTVTATLKDGSTLVIYKDGEFQYK